MLKQLLRSVAKIDSRDDAANRPGHPSRDGRSTPRDAHSRRAELRLPADRLISPDEQVLLLLAKHDGRMWQADIVAETDYSAARVSQLLTEMETDGRITRNWTDGRKVVTLPGIGVGETER